MKITTQKAYKTATTALREHCEKQGFFKMDPEGSYSDVAKQTFTFLQSVIDNTPNSEDGYKHKLAAEALQYMGLVAPSIVGLLNNAVNYLETFEGTVGEYFESFLASVTPNEAAASSEPTPEAPEEPKAEEPKVSTEDQQELSLTIGGVTLTPSKVREKLDEFKFEGRVTNDEIFGALMAILKPVDQIDLGVDYNTPENKFKWAFGNLLFNEVNQTSFKSLEEYEEAYKDNPVIVVPDSITLGERAILNTLLERTLGEPSEDNKVGVMLRCLAMAYTYTDYSFDMVPYFLSVLKLNTLNAFKKHMRNIAGMAYMILEKEKENAYINSVTDDELNNVFSDSKREAEIAKIKAAMEEPVAPISLDKAIPALSSGGGSSSGSFSDVVDVAIGAAVIGAVGFGAYKLYDHFFGSGNASDGDVELMRDRIVSL